MAQSHPSNKPKDDDDDPEMEEEIERLLKKLGSSLIDPPMIPEPSPSSASSSTVTGLLSRSSPFRGSASSSSFPPPPPPPAPQAHPQAQHHQPEVEGQHHHYETPLLQPSAPSVNHAASLPYNNKINSNSTRRSPIRHPSPPPPQERYIPSPPISPESRRKGNWFASTDSSFERHHDHYHHERDKAATASPSPSTYTLVAQEDPRHRVSVVRPETNYIGLYGSMSQSLLQNMDILDRINQESYARLRKARADGWSVHPHTAILDEDKDR